MAITEAEINFLKQTAIKLFKDAYQLHQQLGEKGKLPQRVNAFGENTITADWEAEEVFVKGCQQSGIPICFSSEEHGEMSLVNNPKYRGIMDGIDGTNAYKMGTGRYGTMFAIFEGVNPRYSDYLIAGILEYPSGRILIATKNNGAFILDGDNSYPVNSLNVTTLNPDQTRVYIDGGFEFNRKIFQARFQNFRNNYVGNIENKGEPWGASSMYYFDLVTGKADVVLECTRKRNLEIAVAFGILNEIRAVMVDGNGESLADKRYLEFGQGQNEYIPIISAATKSLASQVVEFLKSSS